MNKSFAIVVSEFNKEICDKLLEGALTSLQNANIELKQIHVVRVPGAIEIPLAAQLLAKSTANYAAIICLGCVIRGETTHYDYVCEQVSQGCMRVMLDHSIPIIFGVLTTENLIQAEDRAGGPEGNKGSEAADAALMMAEVVKNLQTN